VDAVAALLESEAFAASPHSAAVPDAAAETAALQFLATHLASNRACVSGAMLLRVLRYLAAPAAAHSPSLPGGLNPAERESVFCDVVAAAGGSMSTGDQQQVGARVAAGKRCWPQGRVTAFFAVCGLSSQLTLCGALPFAQHCAGNLSSATCGISSSRGACAACTGRPCRGARLPGGGLQASCGLSLCLWAHTALARHAEGDRGSLQFVCVCVARLQAPHCCVQVCS
jgi:hypothetical protein